METTLGDRHGPLAGIKVLELGGIGPTPFCGMLLADMGAAVMRIERPGGDAWPNAVTARGKICVQLDLKDPAAIRSIRGLMQQADVLIEGARPGVMERLGLGPDQALRENPRLVYGRLTGWGQDGPIARSAGHDINYIAITGVLAAMGPVGAPPTPPLNLVGDFGGGSLYMAMGVAAALLAREHSGRGQVIDVAIVDGAASLFATAAGFAASGLLCQRRGENMLDGSCPYYRCYACSDGLYVAVGAVEPQFYDLLLHLLGLAQSDVGMRDDAADWPRQCAVIAAVFKTRTRQDWCALLEGTDACVAPVLDLAEAAVHRQLSARNVYIGQPGGVQPAPAPRFSRDTLAEPAAAQFAGDLGAAKALWG